MSTTAGSSTNSTSSTTSTALANAIRPNVSVTSINCDTSVITGTQIPVTTPNESRDPLNGSTGKRPSGTASPYFGNGSIRISVPKMEESDESDAELSNIERTVSVVNMRKGNKLSGPRPMSWEGELSEHEDSMDVENAATALDLYKMQYVNVNATNHSNVVPEDTKNGIHSLKIIPKEAIKPEYCEPTGELNGTHPVPLNRCPKYSTPHEPIVQLKYEPELPQHQLTPPVDALTSNHHHSLNSPLLVRSKTTLLPANPSPDSAIHSVYTHSSPSQSPLTSRHAHYTPTLSRNNSDASHSSCYSYSSEFSPTHSPIQSRHHMYQTFNGSPFHHSTMYRPMIGDAVPVAESKHSMGQSIGDESLLDSEALPSAGISRQQLINSPCPICGDKISGFHYGIFSCESCKGFFKRTVQNRKNYVCLRGAACPVTIATRKKCPACRFDKCLQRGMKLEAIREDRTRGGRSTYQCSYTIPTTANAVMPMLTSADSFNHLKTITAPTFKVECSDGSNSSSSHLRQNIPTLLQEMMDVEHLWQFNESELSRLNQTDSSSANQQPSSSANQQPSRMKPSANPLLASAGLTENEETNPDVIANLCNVADHRLYKIVKWCKSLPLFKHITIDDQICLLINSWCELLVFSCCFRSMSTPGEVRISLGKSITLEQAKLNGLQPCIERMLNLTDHLRRLRVDRYEYVAMKVIVLLQSDTSELRESEKVRACQEKALQALQAYTLAHYPESPAKFGELLLRIPELQRTCQIGKEMLTLNTRQGDDFNLLIELLRGEH